MHLQSQRSGDLYFKHTDGRLSSAEFDRTERGVSICKRHNVDRAPFTSHLSLSCIIIVNVSWDLSSPTLWLAFLYSHASSSFYESKSDVYEGFRRFSPSCFSVYLAFDEVAPGYLEHIALLPFLFFRVNAVKSNLLESCCSITQHWGHKVTRFFLFTTSLKFATSPTRYLSHSL